MSRLERIVTADDDEQSIVGERRADHAPWNLTDQFDLRLSGYRHYSHHFQRQDTCYCHTQGYLTYHTQYIVYRDNLLSIVIYCHFL